MPMQSQEMAELMRDNHARPWIVPARVPKGTAPG